MSIEESMFRVKHIKATLISNLIQLSNIDTAEVQPCSKGANIHLPYGGFSQCLSTAGSSIQPIAIVCIGAGNLNRIGPLIGLDVLCP